MVRNIAPIWCSISHWFSSLRRFHQIIIFLHEKSKWFHTFSYIHSNWHSHFSVHPFPFHIMSLSHVYIYFPHIQYLWIRISFPFTSCPFPINALSRPSSLSYPFLKVLRLFLYISTLVPLQELLIEIITSVFPLSFIYAWNALQPCKGKGMQIMH